MSKIVMANVKIPILLIDDELKLMPEYIKINIENCNELPEINNDMNNSVINEIYKILSEKKNDEVIKSSLFVSLEEIKRNKQKMRQNFSLKNKQTKVSNYTMKKRSNISNTFNNLFNLDTLDDNLFQQQEVEE